MENKGKLIYDLSEGYSKAKISVKDIIVRKHAWRPELDIYYKNK